AFIQDFLDKYGLARHFHSQIRVYPDEADEHRAMLFVSAAAGALMASQTSTPTPAPAVPDVAVVVYAAGTQAAGAQAAGTEGAGAQAAEPRGPPIRASWPAPCQRVPCQPAPWRLGRWEPSWTPAEHAEAVGAVREAITRGDVYQVNLVGHASARYEGDPLPALRRVAALPGARYGGVLTGDGWAIACASPETLLDVAGGRIVTRPIKGTRPATEAG